MGEQKLRHVVDNVHGAIYLSELESVAMSTPFFFRLHDVYQSSTVYLTLPTNRTKRYEHSVGTMHLAGRIFSAAVANASLDDRSFLLQELERLAEMTLNKCSEGVLPQTLSYTKERSMCVLERVLKKIMEAVKDGEQEDIQGHNPEGECCSRGPLYSIFREVRERDVAGIWDPLQSQLIPIFQDSSPEDIKRVFLYHCALQAVRLAALFHDVGHPPYSHVIEKTMETLYTKCAFYGSQTETEEAASPSEQSYDKERANKVYDILKPYITGTYCMYTCLKSDTSWGNRAFHENVGLKMFEAVLKYSLDAMLTKVDFFGNAEELSHKQVLYCVYYFLVCEFSIGILVESSSLLKSLHRIIDGPIDADRLDYIVRDTKNSGISWGDIPYERIIRSVKLAKYSKNNGDEEKLSLVFPEKLTDDLDDIIVMRYKIFHRINSHHRAVKTARLLRNAVELLSEEYLKSSWNPKLGPSNDIENLWAALRNALTDENKSRAISRWNDSWLTTILSSELVNLSRYSFPIRSALEEILLNRKRYYSLFKRQHDARSLMERIFTRAGWTDDVFKKTCKRLYRNLRVSSSENSTKNSKNSRNSRNLIREGVEALRRIRHLEKIKNTADFDALEIHMDSEEGGICNLIEKVLKDNKGIECYIIEKNTSKNQFGINDANEKDDIYLESSGENKHIYIYNISNCLLDRLVALREANIWAHIYIAPKEDCKDVNELLNEIQEAIVQKIGSCLGVRLKKHFGKGFGCPHQTRATKHQTRVTKNPKRKVAKIKQASKNASIKARTRTHK